MESHLSYTIFVAFLFSCYGMLTISASTCPAGKYLITLKDTQDAGEFTEISYKDYDATSTSNGFQVAETIHKTMNRGEKIKVVVAVNHAKNEMVIAFRGSSSHQQLMEIVKDSIHQDKIDSWFPSSEIKNIKVNRYFLEAFQLVLPSLQPHLMGNKKIIFTGHSLGAALASLLALYTSKMENGPWSNPKTSLITFGQPRIGNKAFAKIHDQMIPSVRKMIFIVAGDPIPRFPVTVKILFWNIEYKHISGKIVLKQSSNEKNGYVCTLSNQCNNLVNGQVNVLDHEVQAYMSFMGSKSHWYNHEGQKKTNLPDSIAGIC